MDACPCCGYRTLPSRAYHDLCPVCWWEDDGSEPWQGLDGPNGQALVHAQRAFLADDRPFRRREGKVRPPRRSEARDPEWRPWELTEELERRVERERTAAEAAWRRKERRAEAQEAGIDARLAAHHVQVDALQAQVADLSHRQVVDGLREIGHLPDALLEPVARLLRDDAFYRRHPVRAAAWAVRNGRWGSYGLRWREVRSGTFTLAG